MHASSWAAVTDALCALRTAGTKMTVLDQYSLIDRSKLDKSSICTYFQDVVTHALPLVHWLAAACSESYINSFTKVLT